MTGQKRWDFQILAGSLEDAGGGKGFIMLWRERETLGM